MLRSAPLAPNPLPSLSPVRGSVDGVTRGAVGRGAGAPLGKVEPGGPRQLWVRRLDLGQARRGRWGAGLARRDWPPLAEEEPPGARRVCLRRDGEPLGGAENLPRAHSLPSRRLHWQPVCRPEMHWFVFDF